MTSNKITKLKEILRHTNSLFPCTKSFSACIIFYSFLFLTVRGKSPHLIIISQISMGPTHMGVGRVHYISSRGCEQSFLPMVTAIYTAVTVLCCGPIIKTVR
jgi:hypothetical protein